jgi:hypothetical protein
MAMPLNVPKRGTGGGGHRLTRSRRRKKRIWLSETEQNAGGGHPLSGKAENGGNHHPWRGLNVAETWLKRG